MANKRKFHTLTAINAMYLFGSSALSPSNHSTRGYSGRSPFVGNENTPLEALFGV